MGWVVSKPLKDDTQSKQISVTHSIPDARTVYTTVAEEPWTDIVGCGENGDKISVVNRENHAVNEANLLSRECNILIVEQEMECHNSSDLVNSSMTNEESLYSLPMEITEQIQLNDDIIDPKIENIIVTLTDSAICCPKSKTKPVNLSKKIHNIDSKPNFKTKKIKHFEQPKKNNHNNNTNNAKILAIRKPIVKNEILLLSENESTVSKRKTETVKSPHKITKKIVLTKNSHSKNTTITNNNNHPKLPPINSSLNNNKNINKVQINKNNIIKKDENRSLNRVTSMGKSKTPVINNSSNNTNETEICRMKEDLIAMLNDRNISPDTVDDIEKNLYADNCDLERRDCRPMFAELDRGNSNLRNKRRPTSAYLMPTNRKENFDNIIEDFNRKLEKIINDNRLMNCLCNNCNQKDPGTENKSNAGKITFFFLKRYGNVGKFILARLNEFLDNAYKESPNQEEKEENLKKLEASSFPLPCSINDIEYEGDLKSYSELAKEGIIIKPKCSKSKLPKLISTNNKTIAKESDNCINQEIISKIVTKNRNESSLSKRKNKTKSSKTFETKIKEKPEKSVDIGLPPLKPASSIINFYKPTDQDKTNNIVFKTVNLSSDSNIHAKLGYHDILNILYDENALFQDSLIQTRVHDSNQTENDACTMGFENNSLKSEEQNEEDISIMANKLIDDLWQSTFLKGCQTKSLVSD